MKLTFYMGIWNEYSIFCVIEESLPSSFNSTQIKAKIDELPMLINANWQP